MPSTPSLALPGLIWNSTPDTNGDTVWTARWRGPQGRVHTQASTLLDELGPGPQPADVRFEIWTAFTLGLDSFVPVLDPSAWAARLAQDPTPAPEPTTSWIVPGAIRAPHDGVYGLEGLLVDTGGGHVFRALTQGLPHLKDEDGAPCRLPVLVPLSVQIKGS